MSAGTDCIFCRIVSGEVPSTTLLADDLAVAFMDINPASNGHCLVVSREHAVTFFDLSEEAAVAVIRAARRLAIAIREALQPDGLNLHQSNGRAASQVVDHFHLHLIPRWSDDGVGLKWAHQGDPSRIPEMVSSIVRHLDGPA